MKYLILAACLVLSVCSLAQRGGKNPSRTIPIAPLPGVSTPTGILFLSGKVVLDDGTPLTEPAAIQTVCRGQRHTEAYTDSKGSFSFEIGRPSNSSAAGLSDADSSWETSSTNRGRNLQDCDLVASLAGFSSDSIDLSSRLAMGERSDLGRIVLHRLTKVEGLTISATSAAAPPPARKNFEKGCKEEAKGHWDQAQVAFQKAVDIYPRYAVAWFELGRVQQQKNETEAARHAFLQSIVADPQYANPYRNLAQLAAFARQWSEVLEFTSKLLALNPVNFPDAWFLNALAYFNQKNLESAEKSARQGIHVDDEHHLPKLEFLLGLVLAQRQQYGEAANHLRQYLRLVPGGRESDAARRQLAEVEQLAANNPTADKK